MRLLMFTLLALTLSPASTLLAQAKRVIKFSNGNKIEYDIFKGQISNFSFKGTKFDNQITSITPISNSYVSGSPTEVFIEMKTASGYNNYYILKQNGSNISFAAPTNRANSINIKEIKTFSLHHPEFGDIPVYAVPSYNNNSFQGTTLTYRMPGERFFSQKLVDAEISLEPSQIFKIELILKNDLFNPGELITHLEINEHNKLSTGTVFKIETESITYLDNYSKPIEDIDKYIAGFTKVIQPKVLEQRHIKSLMKDPYYKRLRAAFLKKSAVILAESGAGKTYDANLFAQGVYNGLFPEFQSINKFIYLRAADLTAGTSYVGTIESKITNLLKYVKANKMVLLIDEIHSLAGGGASEGNPTDVVEMLKPYLESGEIKILGTSTTHEFKKVFGANPAFIRRFNEVLKPALTDAQVITALDNWFLDNKYAPQSKEVYKNIIKFSNQFDITGAQPARAIGLADNVMNGVIVNQGDVNNIKLSPSDIQRTAMNQFNVDKSFFDPALKSEKLKNLEANMSKRIIGNKPLIKKLSVLAYNQAASIATTDAPPIKIIVLGPPGTGKSFTSSVFAESMGYQYSLLPLNDYGGFETNVVDKFKTSLAQKLDKGAFSVITLDELEKSGGAVQNALLTMWQEGYFEHKQNAGYGASSGFVDKKVWLKNTVFVATSNLLQDLIMNDFIKTYNHFAKNISDKKKLSDKVGEVLHDKFSHEFLLSKLESFNSNDKTLENALLSRTDAVIPTFPPTEYQYKKIVSLEISNFIRKQKQRHGRKITISNRATVINNMVRVSYRPGIDGRSVKNALKLSVFNQISVLAVNNHLTEQDNIKVRIDIKKMKANLSPCNKSFTPEVPTAQSQRKMIGY